MTHFLFLLSLAVRAISVTLGQKMKDKVMEHPVEEVLEECSLDTLALAAADCPPPRSEQCQQSIHSKLTWACLRAVSILISHIREVGGHQSFYLLLHSCYQCCNGYGEQSILSKVLLNVNISFSSNTKFLSSLVCKL